MDDKRRLILDQALALVDEQGLAAMSMRAVAERVGLTSMALYPYVGGKDALLDGLVDLLHLELGTAYGDDPADIDWRQRLRALGRAVRALAHAHPGAFPLLLNRAAAAASASWLTAALRATLHDAGVDADQVPRLARMICAFLLGYTTGEVTGGLPGTVPPVAPDESAKVSRGEGVKVSRDQDAKVSQDQDAKVSQGQDAKVSQDQDAKVAGDKSAVLARDDGAEVARDERADVVGAGFGERAAEFDADLDDLVRMVEVAVRVG